MLSCGYSALYREVLAQITEPEAVSEEQAAFVYDVLDMFGALQRYERDSGEKLDARASRFRGSTVTARGTFARSLSSW